MPNYSLTFELHRDASDPEIAIHGSPAGLEALARTLLELIERTQDGYFDHEHLMSDAWGGDDLTSIPQSAESELINHVKIYCWKGGAFQDNQAPDREKNR